MPHTSPMYGVFDFAGNRAASVFSSKNGPKSPMPASVSAIYVTVSPSPTYLYYISFSLPIIKGDNWSMAIGYLKMQARTAHDAVPLSGIHVRVMDA